MVEYDSKWLCNGGTLVVFVRKFPSTGENESMAHSQQDNEGNESTYEVQSMI